MNIVMWSMIVVLLLILLFVVWKFKEIQKNFKDTSSELQFFKKQREYHEEAMLLFSEEYNVVFANQAARDLFMIVDNTIPNYVEMEVKRGDREKFIVALEKLSLKSTSNIRLKNLSLFIQEREEKVNIYIDKNSWNINRTITCIVDTDIKDDKVEASKNMVVVDSSDKKGEIDFLTGLASQFSALSDINNLVMENKNRATSFAMLLLGIDDFKDIQTTLGLHYTNTLIKKISYHLKDMVDENMKLYYMESDKFLFVVNNVKSAESAYGLAETIIGSLSHFYKEDGDIRLTNAIGIVLYPDNGENAMKLTNNVYAALAKAQLGHVSNIVRFQKEDTVVYADEIQMNEEIRKGLIKGEFLLHYQPIFDLNSKKIIGAEALLRWQHPKHGLIAADRFISIAEKTGLIVDLGEYVFEKTIQEFKRCSAYTDDDFKITINLSLKEMRAESLIPALKVLFEKYQIKQEMINIDIPEDIVMKNIEKIAKDFKLFKELGLSLTLEHFGAGCSTLKNLSVLPIDAIKIDRSLIFDLTLNLKHQTTVKAMIEFAHTLGYKVVAEGVETSQETSILKALNCDYVQGYLYARPLPADEFEALLK